MPAPSGDSAPARPRVSGEREQEIFDATLEVLGREGYDRMTMDAVATAARASKATLYRRWSSKSALVIDALLSMAQTPGVPDTGSFRQDLIDFACRTLVNKEGLAVVASVITAVQRDEEFASDFRERFLGPKIRAMHGIYERAQARGDLRDDVDVDLLAPVLAAVVIHRTYLLGQPPSEDELVRIIDQVILRAACP